MTQENIDKLRSFIVTAHLNGNASETGKYSRTDLGKRVFKYTSSNLGYQDEYYTKDHFIGQEMVYHIDGSGPGGPDDVPKFIPIWSMIYRGKLVASGIEQAGSALTKEEIYAFLREALRAIDKEHTILPVRGPRSFKKDGWLYKNHCEDPDIFSFSGEEVIAYNNIVVYKGTYSGTGFTLV